MPRVKRGNVRRAKRKKLLARAKGFYQNKSKLYRAAKESVDTALKYAFVGRRRKKRDFRRLWVVRINAAARENGLTYGQLIAGLKAAGNPIDRKQLADLAVIEPGRVRALAKTAADAKPAATKRPAATAAKRRRHARSRSPRLARRRTGGCRRYALIRTPARVPLPAMPSQFERRRSLEPVRPISRRGERGDLRAVRDRYLARKGGLVSGLLKTLGSAPPTIARGSGSSPTRSNSDIEAHLDARLTAAAAGASARRRRRRHPARTRRRRSATAIP